MLASAIHSPEAIELRRTRAMGPETHAPSDAHTLEDADVQDEDSSLLQDVLLPGERRKLLLRLGLSFFLFGLINNVLYVIILSAALDLVPPSTPKGVILFCNIAPSLLAKLGWPYVLKGRIRYVKRLVGCCLMSVAGMVVVAAFDNLHMRLLGIGFASFSSGLGELTFLQLSTTYRPSSVSGHAVGFFASGTGAAGVVGAAVWWFIRALGVHLGIGISATLPFVIPLTYALVLPPALIFVSLPQGDDSFSGNSAYAPLPSSVEEDNRAITFSTAPSKVALTAGDKWELVRPLLRKYMLPLFCVYIFEYTINQGVSPTLVFPVPSPSSHPILSHVISSIRDYYPLWQLVYQSTVFLSRSTISMGIPPLPSRLLPLPAILQGVILLTLLFESALGIFDFAGEAWSISCVFLLISIEGICGGLAYVNVFYHVGQEQAASDPSSDFERARQEREFKIGSIGFSDSLGILCASLIAMPTEIQLCEAQVRRGKMLCTEL